TRVATWLLQAIDPDTGEVLEDALRGLLAPQAGDTAGASTKGFVSYTVVGSDLAESGAEIVARARVIFDGAPPIESGSVAHTLDAVAPVTTVTATSLGNDAQGLPAIEVKWAAQDDASGVKHVTVYVSENGGDFRIWLKQVAGDQGQAVFTGEAGKTYEFLAVATDKAGNREAAVVANAVLPDDGSRAQVIQDLGVNETLQGTPELPLATPDRSYPGNALFDNAAQGLPGLVAPAQPADLQSVLAPFTLRGFADGYQSS